MIIPSEILLQILKEAACVLSLSELFQARLVNKEFSNEILSLSITTTFLDKQLRRWATFPESIKRRYLRQKIKQHAKTPCVFSYFVHEALDSHANVLNTEAERERYIDKILEAVRWLEKWNLSSWMLLTNRYNLWVKRHKEYVYSKLSTPYDDMSIAIVCSAIKRGDATELDSVLKQGRLPLHKWCYRWGVLPLHFAAQYGRKEVIKVLIKHGYPRHYYVRSGYRYALDVAAQNNNEGALEAWVENPNPDPMDPRSPYTNHHIGVSTDLGKAMRIVVREGNMKMIRFIEKQFPRDMRIEILLFEGVTVAIQYGLPDVVRHFLELGGFDIHMHRESFFKGLLMTAILDCNAETRPRVVRLLLEYGVDPNHTFTEERQRVSGTPLQRAILKGDVETMRSLVEYGAEVNATSVGRHGRWNRVCSLPPLIHAMRGRSTEMVRVLLENGANRTCLSRWQTLLVKTGEEKVSDEDIVIWKGMDLEETYSFVVVKQRSRKRKAKKLEN